MEHKVEKTTSFVAYAESQSYLEASMLVVAPAGIAAKRTVILLDMSVTGTTLLIPKSRAGIKTRRCTV